MGTNRRYGAPADRAELRRRRAFMISPNGRQRIRHCWVQVNATFADSDAPGLIVEWAHRVVYVPDGHTRLTPIYPR